MGVRIIVNPANGEPVAEVPDSRADDVAAAAERAEGAAAAWGSRTAGERARVLLRLADLLESDADELTRLEVEDTGKPRAVFADGELPFAADNLRFFAGAGRSLEGTGAGELSHGYTSMLLRRPIGVVGSIAPWNFPLVMAVCRLRLLLYDDSAIVGSSSPVEGAPPFLGDGRIAFGAAAISPSFSPRIGPAYDYDEGAMRIVTANLHKMFPSFRDVPIAAGWGGPIDISSLYIPYFGTLPGGNVHYGFGYTGNGVGPSHVGGNILAELALHEEGLYARLAIAKLESELSQLESAAAQVMVTETIEPRETRILPRGNWMDESGTLLQSAVPEFLGKLDTGGRRATRLDLANWLLFFKERSTAGRNLAHYDGTYKSFAETFAVSLGYSF